VLQFDKVQDFKAVGSPRAGALYQNEAALFGLSVSHADNDEAKVQDHLSSRGAC
jgi:2-keto-3-deoxy-galactonokinase